MLNNLTNFFNLIKGRKIKTQLESDDIIAVGTKQSPALGDYKPTAIKFSDLQAQVSVPYKSYVAYLGQSGTNDPVPTVLENTLGVGVTFKRITDGSYIMLFDESVFTSPYSALVTISQQYNYDPTAGFGNRVEYGIGYYNVIFIETTNIAIMSYEDNILGSSITPCIIEVRIYN